MVEVHILSRKLIKPSTPTPNHLQNYKLSFFDQLAPPAHIPLIFFYTPNDDELVINSHEEKLQQLEKSLSETLTLYYPQAGRFVKDELLVDCNDQGVEFVEAKADGKLGEFLSGGLELELLDQFVPDIRPAMLVTTPIVALQATIFECGGLALCVKNSHIIADGYTGCTFINAWATANRLGIDKVIQPNFTLPSLFPSRDLSEAVVSLPPPNNGTMVKVITRRFVFDEITISTLKDKIISQRGDDTSGNDREPKKLEVVISALWKALIQAARANHNGQRRPSLMTLPVNLRGRLGLPTPENSCGNLFTTTPAKFEAEESNLELNHLVSLVRGSIRTTLSSCAKLSQGDEIFSAVVNLVNEMRKGLIDKEVDAFNFTSMCGFPLYEIDFGWGKPSFVSNECCAVEIIALTDTKSGTGIEAWVSLNEPDMLELEQDPELVALITPSSSK